jgi:DNA-binding NtrC family response regulator
VRELRNVIEHLVIMSDDEITERDLPPLGLGPATLGSSSSGSGPGSGPVGAADLRRYAGLTLRDFRDEIEREFLCMKLDEREWNISRTASALQIERTNLHKRLRALGLSRESKE